MHQTREILISVPQPFSLGLSAGPAKWSGEGSPRHAVLNRSLVSVESGGGAPVLRRITQDVDDVSVQVTSTEAAEDHGEWFTRTFRPMDAPDVWPDHVIGDIAARIRGIRAFTDGSLFIGILTSIIGQSISLASAAAVQRRLALSFSDGVDVEGRKLVPLPDAALIADAPVELLRASGMTWKRAEALKIIAQEQIDGNLPTDTDAAGDSISAERALLSLPMVGKWTAASTLLWGIGAPDAFPSGDVALLRAARVAYDRPGMTLKDLDVVADQWRPFRGTATRLLWADLLGPAW